MVGRAGLTNFEYDPERPARHCRLCGESYQPALARTDEYLTSPQVQMTVEVLLRGWADDHNSQHSQRLHEAFRDTGMFLTPEATEKLVPLGIIPVQDIVLSSEHAHAALQAKRAPNDDIRS